MVEIRGIKIGIKCLKNCYGNGVISFFSNNFIVCSFAKLQFTVSEIFAATEFFGFFIIFYLLIVTSGQITPKFAKILMATGFKAY